MRRTPVHVMLLVAALAAALAGCSRMPTAPTTDPTTARPGSNPGILQEQDPPPPPITPGISNTITLQAGEDGTIESGVFTVVIRKNSLKMPATIKVFQPDPTVMQAEFEVTPPEANDFQVPVQVIANCSGEGLAQAKKESMFWWDGDWIPVDTSLDHSTLMLWAQTKVLTTCKVDIKQGSDIVQH